MDHSLKQLMKIANDLLKEADPGKEYTMDYVVERLDSAMNDYPHDPIISSVAQIVGKQVSKGKLTTSQKELYEIYNSFANLSSTSMVKEAIGDLLYPVETPKPTMSSEDTFGRQSGASVDLTIADNPLEGIFDKSKTAAPQPVPVKPQKPIQTADDVVPTIVRNANLEPAIEMPKVALPEALKDLVNFEESVLDASTQFSPELVRTAKAVCLRELNDMGFRAQVRMAETTNDCIICAAELDSSSGKVEIKLPVEIINDKPQVPALFYNEASKDQVFDFGKKELVKFLNAAQVDNSRIMRYSNDFLNMTYNQLKDEILSGVATKNYTRAEEALNRIEDKFGPEQHRVALAEYAKMLSVSSAIHTHEPKHQCRLLITKGSMEPRCGHFHVPVSKVVTDKSGNCELIERKAKYDNMDDATGTVIRTGQIKLT